MGKRINREKTTVALMIEMYCRGHRHLPDGAMCPRCSQLLGYADRRLSRCPHGEEKPACRRCTIHCYSPDMRDRIAQVMRWSRKRMIYRHPIAALRHLVSSARGR